MGFRVSLRTSTTLGLILGLLVAFAWATYLAYWGGKDVSNAFDYQSAVVAAQRDVELLGVEQFDRKAPADELRRYEKLLDTDLARINRAASTPDERVELHAKKPYARGGGWDVNVDADEKIMVMEWNAEHNDVNFSETTQGSCFSDQASRHAALSHCRMRRQSCGVMAPIQSS